MKRRDLLKLTALTAGAATLKATPSYAMLASDLAAPSPEQVKRVLMVSLCHLDVGFIATQAKVMQKYFEKELAKKTTFEDFFAQAPRMNPSRSLITGVVCGVRVEDIEDGTMREIRYLDKLVDELAKGKSMEKILRR